MAEENVWENGYISASSSKYWFVVVIKHGVTAVYPKAVAGDANFGDFCRVTVRKNPFQPNQRAQYTVVQYEKIPPLDNYRLYEYSGITHVVITTTAEVSGFTDYRGKRIALLTNEKFGTFVDIDNVIRNDMVRVKFEFKARSSPIDSFLTIFVPYKFLELLPQPEPPKPRSRRGRSRSVGAPKLVEGFVGHENDDFFWVWCKEFDHDVHLHKDYCPEKNMMGRWIEMSVLQERKTRFRVCQKVHFIDDLIKCRVINGVPELNVQMTNFGELDGEYPQFHNNIIGSIVDVDQMSENVQTGEIYSAWIARHKWETTKSRWKLSPKQDIIGDGPNVRNYSTTGHYVPRNRDSSDEESESIVSGRYSDEDDDMFNNRKLSEQQRKQEEKDAKQLYVDLNNLTTGGKRSLEDESLSGSTPIDNDSSRTRRANKTTNVDDLRLRTIMNDFLKCKEVRTAMKLENSEAYDELANILKF